MKNKVILIIRDGWGINENPVANSIAIAKTPNIDFLLKNYPNTKLIPSGEEVGLPKGYQGSSEVGHLNIGAGRIVKQEVSRVNEAIEDGSFFANHNFKNAINNCLKNNSALHLMGLIQNEGVHAHYDHIFAILKYASEKKISQVYIHFFSDGRDTPPRSSLEFLNKVNAEISSIGLGKIGTIMGRYYAMDRGLNWNLTDKAYNAMINLVGETSPDAKTAITTAYDKTLTPTGTLMTDEYILPTIIGDFPGIKDGDSVIHCNYRQDRAIQLTNAFIQDDYKGNRKKKLDIVFCGLTRYYDSFEYNILEALDSGEGMENLLGEVISDAGFLQLRIAETQKFKHVTSFFNGKKLNPYKNEDRIEIAGRFDPSSFAEHPEMEAYIVKDKVIEKLIENKYDLIVLNFANGDMVGHTGNLNSAVKAIEVVDECVGEIVKVALKHNVVSLITADHGNAEQMIDYETGFEKTAHTTNPVEFILVGNDVKNYQLIEEGILADIAPTILYLLGIKKPTEMTARNIINSSIGK